jgi:lipopolysaccharide transport system ATP-binding protein
VVVGDAVIITEDLGKRYRRAVVGRGRLRDVVTDTLSRRRDDRPVTEPFWALRHVDLEVMAGQVTGVIGRNGAGKSTLLKLLSRITTPTEGRAEILGRVGSLLEVGTGFHVDLTGRENVFFSGAVLGMSRAEVRRKLDAIVDFSGVEKFIDTPVKHYSSGMQVRLGFAVAAHLEPEILIVDEVLAVGDEEFQRKCLDKIGEVATKGLAILLVSHDLAAVRSRCDVAHLFDGGQVVASGTPQEIVDTYVAQVVSEGPKVVAARGWRLNGSDIHTLESNAACTIEIDVEVAAAIADATIALQIGRDAMTLWEGSVHADLEPRAYSLEFELAALPLSSGTYEVALAVSAAGGLRTAVALEPGLVVAPGGSGGPIVAAGHAARVIER